MLNHVRRQYLNRKALDSLKNGTDEPREEASNPRRRCHGSHDLNANDDRPQSDLEYLHGQKRFRREGISAKQDHGNSVE